MALPVRTSVEIYAIINKSQHALADIGYQVINEKKQGIDITDTNHRDKVYRMILLRVYLQNLIDADGNLLSYYTASLNEKKLNQILDGLVHLSKGFDGPSIPLLGVRNFPLIFYPSTASNGGGSSGGPATPGGTVFQGTANSPSTLIDTFNASLSTFAFYIVSVDGTSIGQGIRTELIIATWSGSSDPVYAQVKTENAGSGNTSDVTLKVELAAGMIQLNAYTTSDGWKIKGLRILFQNISFVNPIGPLPAGGTLGQILAKASDTDYDVLWKTLTANLITDLTASATELNYSQGVTSAIQTQIDAEVAARAAAVSAEAAARASGDATLQANINNIAATYLPLAGGTMTGPIDMGTQKITNLALATNPADAARYDQVPQLPSNVDGYLKNDGAGNLSWSINGSWSSLSYNSGWAAVSDALQYRKDAIGRISLRGSAVWSSGSITNLDIGTLPVGYRPSKQVNVFQVFNGTTNIYISITTAGAVHLSLGTSMSGVPIYVDSISFWTD